MRISLALLFALLAGCAPPKGDSETFKIEPYARVDESKTPDHAQWVFAKLLKGLGSHEHYVLEAQFLAPTGYVRLHSHLNGFMWRDGDQIEFRRDGEHLYLNLSTPHFSPRTTELKGFLDSEGHFKARVEVDNTGQGGVRILVWNFYSSLQGEVDAPRPFISAGNADVDSKALGWIFMSRGTGAKWGVEFENATVLSAHREAPYAD